MGLFDTNILQAKIIFKDRHRLIIEKGDSYQIVFDKTIDRVVRNRVELTGCLPFLKPRDIGLETEPTCRINWPEDSRISDILRVEVGILCFTNHLSPKKGFAYCRAVYAILESGDKIVLTNFLSGNGTAYSQEYLEKNIPEPKWIHDFVKTIRKFIELPDYKIKSPMFIDHGQEPASAHTSRSSSV